MTSQSQFQSDDSLRKQRMTEDEAKAVIDRWQQERVEQTGLTNSPAVPDVAEGLDIGVEDVQRLLQEVRARRIAEESRLAQERELEEIRLAEEEHKLAEVRRARAELQRQRNELERMMPYQTKPKAISQFERDLQWQIPVGIIVFLIVIWMFWR